jgi:glycosyltransferase involved in cell wall biosynthesis
MRTISSTSADEAAISVVIPTYNRGHIVHKAIDSVLAQSHRPLEIIVVDDGSMDNTGEKLKAYGDRIRYIRRENGGLSRARNTGIEAARGEWIAFLDDDDEFVADKLAIHAQSAARHPHFDVHATNTVLISEVGESVNLWEFRGVPDPGECGVLERPLLWISRGCFFTQSVMIRRRALVDAGLYDPSMIYEDVDLFLRLPIDRPWGVDNRAQVVLFRRAGADYNLSQGIVDKPLVSYACLVKIYSRLLEQCCLSAQERTHIRWMLAGFRFELGAAHVRQGAVAEAEQCFVQAMRDNPTLKTRLKGCAALVSRGWSLDALRSFRARRGGMRRSKPALARPSA